MDMKVSSGSVLAGRCGTAAGPTRRQGHASCVGLAALCAALVTPAEAQPPQRDLIVEVRLVEGNEATSTATRPATTDLPAPNGGSISSTPPQADMPRTRTLRILNGTRGSLQFMRSIPSTWTVAASGHAPSSSASASAGASVGAGAGDGGGSIVNALTWQQAGYALSILPQWPGARAPVTVRIELDIAHVGDKFAAEMPESSNQRVVTTVVSPLGRWTTFAVLGSARDATAGSSWSASTIRQPETQLLQVKVLAP